ncbi:hypothetical protein [Glycomyces salinus]|uniref:hypothetical protein n=1 Tax=Glycomyces salinus TaxID=980294 RepID=UPI0018EA3E87|nr:hypothetical protein [Glycomyces salinus]
MSGETSAADERFKAFMIGNLGKAAEQFGATVTGEPRFGWLLRSLAFGVAAGTAPGEYARAKTALVQELTDRARAERGLPPEPVWEKR